MTNQKTPQSAFKILRRNSGFTIVELLVVIVIIGILAAITIVSYTGITSKAVAASLQADLSSISTRLKMYQAENGSFPTTLDANGCPSAPVANTSYCLKFSSGNSSVEYVADASTFSLTASNANGTTYIATEGSIVAGANSAAGVASAPTSLIATAGAGQVSLAWTAPSSDGGSPITGYKIYRSTSSNAATLVQTLGVVTSYTDTGLTAGSTYYFRIKAINSRGDSSYSNESNATALDVISLTFNNTATGQNGTLQQWTVPATGSYVIEAWGAQGGNTGGLGARMRGTFDLISGSVIKILVGQMGSDGGCAMGPCGGGGGGTFVTMNDNTPLIVAGGGGGNDGGNSAVMNAVSGNTGVSSSDGMAGGAGPNGGSTYIGGAGAGLSGNGSNGWSGCGGGISFTAGGAGGWGFGAGGYGGGGGGCFDDMMWDGNASGGGGGYGGGGSAYWGSGGGGGSYNIGTNQSNSDGARSGQGLVTINN